MKSVSLLLLRHAIADDSSPDSARELTPEGIRKLANVLDLLASIAPDISLILSSPYKRAYQTAKILKDSLKLSKVPHETIDTIFPESAPQECLVDLRRHGNQKCIALVGHEPHLGTLASYLLGGKADSVVEFKKSGAALLSLSHEFIPGNATLHWLITPKIAKRSGDE